jgi:hypothetical protein
MTNERQLFNQLLDGGATLTGRPYFVMELVKGVPITEFCNENNLGTVGPDLREDRNAKAHGNE